MMLGGSAEARGHTALSSLLLLFPCSPSHTSLYINQHNHLENEAPIKVSTIICNCQAAGGADLQYHLQYTTFKAQLTVGQNSCCIMQWQSISHALVWTPGYCSLSDPNCFPMNIDDLFITCTQ